MEEKLELNKDLIYKCVIGLAIGMIITSALFIYYEINGAKKSCEEIGMTYNFKIPYEHLCNNQSYLKYNTGWDFERELNLSDIDLKRIVFP